MEQVIKNDDVSILNNFLAIFFSVLFLISRNFTKYYLHAKFQINWTIQTEITKGGRAESAVPGPYQFAKIPACLGVSLLFLVLHFTSSNESGRLTESYTNCCVP